MKAVIQRVLSASVSVNNEPVSAIGTGVCLFLGIEETDTEADALWLAHKVATLRIFEDDAGKMNRSVTDIGGAVLVVSQFTLLADCDTGRRPSFTKAGNPDVAKRLYLFFSKALKDLQIPVKNGIFGADMLVRIENNGPATFILQSPRKQ